MNLKISHKLWAQLNYPLLDNCFFSSLSCDSFSHNVPSLILFFIYHQLMAKVVSALASSFIITFSLKNCFVNQLFVLIWSIFILVFFTLSFYFYSRAYPVFMIFDFLLALSYFASLAKFSFTLTTTVFIGQRMVFSF